MRLCVLLGLRPSIGDSLGTRRVSTGMATASPVSRQSERQSTGCSSTSSLVGRVWERSAAWPVIGQVLFAAGLLVVLGGLTRLVSQSDRPVASRVNVTVVSVPVGATDHIGQDGAPTSDTATLAASTGSPAIAGSPSTGALLDSATSAPASTLAADSTVPIAVVVPATTAIPSMLDSLVVAMLENSATYRRDAFGPDWIDADRDCHNTRAEVLMQETAAPVTFNPNGCTVATGQWTDPWSGFTSTLASDFQIDHLVPLANAWRSGAAGWDGSRREAFAQNLDEPDELNALHGPVNTAKSDKTPDQWKPPLEQSWCRYATAWIRIKATWGLTVTAGEKSALASMLERC